MKKYILLLSIIGFCLGSYPLWAGEVSGDNFPDCGVVAKIDLSFIKSINDKRIKNSWIILRDKIQSRFGLGIDSMESVEFFAEDNNKDSIGLVVEDSTLKERDIRRFLNKVIPNESKESVFNNIEAFFVPGILSLFFEEGKLLITDYRMGKIFIKSKGPKLRNDKNYKYGISLLKGLVPDFFLFTYPGTIVSGYFEMVFNIPEFINSYKTILISLKGNYMIFILGVKKDSDKDRIEYKISEKIKNDSYLSSIFEIDGMGTKENSILFRLKLKNSEINNIVLLFLKKIINMIPDENMFHGEVMRCVKRIRRLKYLIMAGKLSPDKLNGRISTSCPAGGKYIFREGPFGPEIICTKHKLIH